MSDSINELEAALCKAQSAMKAAPKTSENPFFKSKYADLSAIVDVSRGPLTDNGISIKQSPITEIRDGVVWAGVVTIMSHSSGQRFVSDPFLLPVDKPTPQAVGSAITYARRYALAAIVGVATEDDDAESAMDRRPTEKKPPKPIPHANPIKAKQSEEERKLANDLFKELTEIATRGEAVSWRGKISDLRKAGALSEEIYDKLFEMWHEHTAKFDG